MGKQEHGKPQSEAKKPEAGAKGSAPAGAAGHAGGAHGAPAPSHSSGKAAAVKLGCQAQGCKGKDTRFSFCEEHFKQFKFGLIKKNGEPVSDFEKKFEHYQQWLKAQKVA